MTSGGPRIRSGRPPDPNALRRDRHYADDEWTTLPVARTGPAPKWPLLEPTARELALWEREWRRPQAVIWEARGQEIEVALYIQAITISEQPNAGSERRAIVLRFLEDLGISQAGLARNRWRLSPPTAQPERTKTASTTESAKARLKLVAS